MKTLNITDCSLEISSIEKDTPQRLFSTTLERNQPLCRQAPRKDSWMPMLHLKKVPNPDWTCTPTGDLKIKISRNWSQWQPKGMRTLSQDDWTKPVYFFLTIASHCILPSLTAIYHKTGKPFWLLDLPPGTLICSWCWRSLGLQSIPLHLRQM